MHAVPPPRRRPVPAPLVPSPAAGPAHQAPAALAPDRRTAAADELLATLASIRRSGRRHAERPKELAELNGSQLELVRLVRRRPGVSVTDAAAELRLAPNTVSTLVGQLTESGTLLRLADASDRRVARLDLAEDTRRKVDACRDRRVEALADALARLPAADERRLAAALPTLSRLAEVLAATVPTAPGPGAAARVTTPAGRRAGR